MSSPRSATVITPSDGSDLANPCGKIYVGTGGDLKVCLAKDNPASGAVIFKNVPSGTTLEIAVRRVYLTGTTATNLLALHG